jgi:hypothetical protein
VIDDRCKNPNCQHLLSDHYCGPDPDYSSLESVYCDHEGCMCWERFAINRENKGPLTPDRKPGRAP